MNYKKSQKYCSKKNKYLSNLEKKKITSTKKKKIFKSSKKQKIGGLSENDDSSQNTYQKDSLDKQEETDFSSITKEEKISKLLQLRKEVDKTISDLDPKSEISSLITEENNIPIKDDIIKNNQANISFSLEEKISLITNDLSNKFKGWRDLKKQIRLLPYNASKDKYGWLTLLDPYNNNLMVELIILSNNIANGTKLQFENLAFRSNPSIKEYKLHFKNLLTNIETKNHIYFPFPITIPVLYIEDLIKKENLVTYEDFIPRVQLNHVNESLQNKNLSKSDFNKCLNSVNFSLDSKKKTWYTNLVNIYQALGFYFNDEMNQEDLYCKIDPSSNFWDNSLDTSSNNSNYNLEYNKWVNKKKDSVGISGIQINIKRRPSKV